jgi:uncharacterized membrane protein
MNIMYFLPISLAIFLMFLLVIPFLLVILPAVAFSKLGLSPLSGILFYFFCLMGSLINIPVSYREREHPEEGDELTDFFSRFFGIRIPLMHKRVIALNLGGAILPGLLCLYLLTKVDMGTALLATAVTTGFSYFLSKPVKGIGIVIPAFIPPIIAAMTALLFAERESAPAIAYICGVLGTLIGADLLRLHQIKRFGLSFLSIGGAGVFDGIFIVGIIAVLLA